MKSKYFLVAVFLGISLVLSGCGSETEDSTSVVDKDAEIIFFYGRECPHCKVVEEYINQNKVAEKIKFAQAEVYHNKANAEFMMEKQKKCAVEKEMIGAVPFLWTKDKCFLGQEEIIQFFKLKTEK